MDEEWRSYIALAIGAHSKNPELPSGLDFSSESLVLKALQKKLNPTSTTADPCTRPLYCSHTRENNHLRASSCKSYFFINKINLYNIAISVKEQKCINNNEGPRCYARWQHQVRLMSRINDAQQCLCHGAILTSDNIMSLICEGHYF